jgi:hypothetical protein
LIKSRRVRWAGHVAHVRKRRGTFRVWWGKLKERNHLEDIRVDERILLKCIFKDWAGGGGAWIGLIWLRIWTVGGLL